MPMFQQMLVSTRPKKKIDVRNLQNLLSRVHLGPREAKLAVILVFTFCWLFIALARSNAPRQRVGLVDSSLMGLATSLQQRAISGRDFQSVFGPTTQFVAWAATRITKTRSSLDAYGTIVFFFGAASAILIACMLLVCDRISWKESAVVYGLCFLLNLFFELLDFRTALLLLNAAFAYRIIAAETMTGQTMWATATGLLCFVSQLVTFELGIYALVTVVCALLVGAVVTRNGWVTIGIETFVATLAAANIGLVVFFKLTSSNYGLVFDYHNYSLEILRGYHNSMGILWQLPSRQTVVLVLATSYVVGKCIMVVRKSDPAEACLFTSMAVAALVWLKTTFVISDIPHITAAFTPMIVVLGLLAAKGWESRQALVAWSLAVCGVFFAWPSLSLSAPADIVKIVRGEVPVPAAVRNLYTAEKPLEAGILPNWMSSHSADRPGVPVLSFPYENHIGVGVRRRIFAPVLESYASSTDSLQRYYIDALDRQRRAGLDVIYGADGGVIPLLGGIQGITRAPRIFEYLYRNFELASNEDHPDGHYKLRERHPARDLLMEELEFSIPRQLIDSGTFKLDAPSTCGVVRVEMQINYSKNPRIFRPSGIELSFSDSDQLVWRGSVRPLELGQTFVTYVSPLPPETFPKIFGSGPVQGVKWDKIEYRDLPSDPLGSRAKHIQITGLHCLDPQKFAASIPAQLAN
jgi:hypothetical protein